jgi:hypothetical protein
MTPPNLSAQAKVEFYQRQFTHLSAATQVAKHKLVLEVINQPTAVTPPKMKRTHSG